MKKIALLGLIPLLLCGCNEKEKSVVFEESDAVIVNPAQGFVSYSQSPKTDNILPYGVGYGRYDWSDFEPEDGKYDWRKIDELIANYAKIGLPVSFRITCANYHSRNAYATPKWALDKGIKYKAYNWEKERQNPKSPFTTMTRYTPYFDEPLLIELHARFVKKLAERYDGNPHISSIDIGGYGNWGEWHTHRLGIPEATPESRKKFADTYLDNFKKTQLVFMSDDAKTLAYALGKANVGIRRDGVGGSWHYKNWIGSKKYAGVANMDKIWENAPVLLEFIASPHKEKDWSLERAANFILDNHCQLFNDNLHFKNTLTSPADKPQTDRLRKYVGARLVAEKADLKYSPTTLEISLEGKNIGCSKIYLPFELVYYIYRTDGGKFEKIAELKSTADPTRWLPDQKFTATDKFALPKNLPNGEYSLFAGLVNKDGVLRNFKFANKEIFSLPSTKTYGEEVLPIAKLQ